MTPIIAFCNHKGGVGKTTTTAQLGSLLSKAGARVLIADLDAQGNLSCTFLLDVTTKTVYDCMRDHKGYTPVHITDTLDLLPADVNLSSLDLTIGGALSRESILADVLADLKVNKRYDFVLLDCPPSFGLITINALVAATHLIVPIVPEFYPSKGLLMIQEMCDRVKAHLNPKIDISGIIITRYNSSKGLYREIVNQLKNNYGDKVFNTMIRENVRLAECPSVKKDISEYAPESNGAKDYAELTKELLSRLQIS